MKKIFFLILLSISMFNVTKITESSSNNQDDDQPQILKIKNSNIKKKRFHVINPEFVRFTRSKGKVEDNLELPKIKRKKILNKKVKKDPSSDSSEQDPNNLSLNENFNSIQNINSPFPFSNSSVEKNKLNFVNLQNFNFNEIKINKEKNEEDFEMHADNSYELDDENFDLETMVSENDMKDTTTIFEDNRFDIISNNQKIFEVKANISTSHESDSNGLITFGIELESAEMVSKIADPESDDYTNAYINCNEWYLFNDSGRVFEMATKKGYSINQIKKIAFEIQLTWLKMISLTPKGNNVYNFKKDELIIRVGNVDIKANRNFGILRKKKIPWLSPQITMKLPLNRINKLFTFFLYNNNTKYIGRGKNGPRSGRINEIVRKVHDINNGFSENGLINLWLFYLFTLFYQKNEVNQLNELGELINVDLNANDGSNMGFGPKQNVMMLSRIGFYDMYHSMTIEEQQDFKKNKNDICLKIDCNSFVIIKYMNSIDEEDSLFKGKIINNSLTFKEWTESIINGDENFKNQRKLDLTSGENITVENTDKLSPPLGFRSSFDQEHSDYDETRGVDRIYGMGCMTNIKPAEVNGVVQNDTLALLEFRDYAINKMKGNYIIDYLTSELEGIMKAVENTVLII